MRHETWEIDSLRVWEVKRYICLDFKGQPSDEARLKLYKSPFMYGWLDYFNADVKGRACWFCVADEETRALAQEIVRL
ncbi:MAG TPA: hypothetical protein VIY48_04495 [Candidatus Paceibacterota bacterium]